MVGGVRGMAAMEGLEYVVRVKRRFRWRSGRWGGGCGLGYGRAYNLGSVFRD
jgi:hypothetical protein